MSQPDNDAARSSNRRILSALADGDATGQEAERAFAAWREDEHARAAWHSYHLIGDVLRSEDLACRPAADEAFLVALRARLAGEPVVLAPQPRAEEAPPAVAVANGGATRLRQRWQGPIAMAAGFLAVIGGLNVMRAGHGGAVVASASAPASAGVVVAAAPATASSPLVATSAKADADQLAPYLAAHRQSAMNGAFQLPGGDLRNVSLVQPGQ